MQSVKCGASQSAECGVGGEGGEYGVHLIPSLKAPLISVLILVAKLFDFWPVLWTESLPYCLSHLFLSKQQF
jgi:hypothetical protein